MNKRYLLGKSLQATLFALLLVFSTNRKTVAFFVIFFVGFFALSVLMDVVFGKILDRKIKKELEKLEEEE